MGKHVITVTVEVETTAPATLASALQRACVRFCRDAAVPVSDASSIASPWALPPLADDDPPDDQPPPTAMRRGVCNVCGQYKTAWGAHPGNCYACDPPADDQLAPLQRVLDGIRDLAPRVGTVDDRGSE